MYSLFVCHSVSTIIIINIHKFCLAVDWCDICLLPATTFCQTNQCNVIKQLTYCQDTCSYTKHKRLILHQTFKFLVVHPIWRILYQYFGGRGGENSHLFCVSFYYNRGGLLLGIFIYVPHRGHFLRVEVSV